MATSPPKRFVDIEVALRWAFRDELPKRARGGRFASLDFSAVAPVFRQAVTAGGRELAGEPGFPAAAGDPHPDAFIIEKAVKDLARHAGCVFDQAETDPAGLLYGLEHWPIDHVQAVAEATGAMVGIVTVHARARTRPACSSKLPAPKPDKGPNGKPKVMIDVELYETDAKGTEIPGTGHTVTEPSPPIRAGKHETGAYCPLVYVPAPAGVVTARAEYAVWRAALELLAAGLEGGLASIAPLPPAAPWRPWCGETEAHGRPPELFLGLRESPHRRQTREQEAAKRRARQRRKLYDRNEETRPVHKPSGGRDRANGT